MKQGFDFDSAGRRGWWRSSRGTTVRLALAILLVLSCVGNSSAQNAPAPAQQPAPPPQEPTPDSAGPGDTGAIAIPKKKEKAPEAPAPVEPKVKNPPQLGNFSLRVDVPIVTVDVGVVLQKTHQFVPGLKPENFRVYEDGVPQQVTGFQRTQAPITALMICEFASTNYWFVYDMKNAAYTFAQQLRPDDYVAVMTFDMRTQILTDFTQDKRAVYDSLNSLQIPGFSERNLFDALYEGLDRLTRIDGHKYIILIASGRDTFSKITLDKMLKKVKDTPNVTIFSIGTGQTARLMAEGRGAMDGIRGLDYLQADNQMSTFARMTGGVAYFPRFEGELPDIFHSINDTIRNQYELTYKPSNPKQDGSYRKLRVELVDNEGQPLKMQDEKHKQLKYDIIARDGYKARQQVD